ncbi:MAG: D-lactate dehydrogenase [Proteobacteria bacterium]|nr:D-lactate dehydrogenase [Pseudomonadota bacterium]MDA1351655.1 D-lactate dehydrogenase [Pseudomonadota bacterium]
MMKSSELAIERLKELVGPRYVLTDSKKTAFYRKGWRSGEGTALAVVSPGNLIELWHTLEVCVGYEMGIIMQAANTGLTEGSSPSGNGYDREIVIVSTLRLKKVIVLPGNQQVLSYPGVSLHQLEQKLSASGRVPHSVIGSSCLGASVTGGVANNSGGALVKRGPAYTELSLYARVNESGKLELINNLGICDIGEKPLEVLKALEDELITVANIENREQVGSDQEYQTRVRDVSADTPARYNADTRRLVGASGCAGKVAILALRTDTFSSNSSEQTFYLGTNSESTLTELRRDILSGFENLPEMGEYMHRDCFDAAQKYGKDTVLLLGWLGTKKMPALFKYKATATAFFNRFSAFPKNLPDRILQIISRIFPQVLPQRLCEFRDQYEHHLILKMSGDGIDEARRYLDGFNRGKKAHAELAYFECNSKESEKALLNRFAAAGAALRYATMHTRSVEDVLPIDVALKRNDLCWVDQLPPSTREKLIASFYYGHFFCYVFHQDYLVRKGENVEQVKAEILKSLQSRGAKYPAEHNVGNLYQADAKVQDFYRSLDPTNTFNPGVGKMSKFRAYQ